MLTGDLTKCHWIVPFVTQKTLVKLNWSQNKTKSHESGRGTGREKEGLIGMGGRKDDGGGGQSDCSLYNQPTSYTIRLHFIQSDCTLYNQTEPYKSDCIL